MLKPYLEKLVAQRNLTTQECQAAAEIMLQSDNHIQIAAFLALLRAKQETSDEILGIVKTMREHMIKVELNYPVLDIVGTGGDAANTINISTGASILAASCGVKVAKHGNRRSTSQCGAADVLEALGVNINLDAKAIKSCLEQVGMAFCFAANFQPAMKKLKETRIALGIPTLFNMLGPLLNPTNTAQMMLGVFSEKLLAPIADVLFKLGTTRSLVFHGTGLDELSCIGPANIIEVTAREKKSYILDPQEFGFATCSIADLRGGTPQQNAETLKDVFRGKTGPITDTLIFNAAVALYLYGKTPDIASAIPIVKQAIQNGDTTRLLENLIKVSNTIYYEKNYGGK